MKENPHQWGNPSNARGKVRVHMHGYPGGTVKMLTDIFADMKNWNYVKSCPKCPAETVLIYKDIKVNVFLINIKCKAD
jgi:hypothetical protein